MRRGWWSATRNVADAIALDLRCATRALQKNKVFTVVVALTMALGVGVNSTIFSWINSTLLRPIPGIENQERLVCVTDDGEGDGDFSYPDYLDVRAATRTFEGLAAHSLRPLHLTGGEKPLRVWGTLVSADYFEVLGVKPVVGRLFSRARESASEASSVVVIAHAFWQTRYAGKKDVIGSSISLNSHPYVVIGVAPPAFQGSRTGLGSDVWVPVSMARSALFDSDRLSDRGGAWLSLIGRTKAGVTEAQARSEVALLMANLATEYPESHPVRPSIDVHPMWRAPSGLNVYLYRFLPMLLALACVVLLLACVNVANLMLLRLLARRYELGTRLALGASRRSLIRQLMLEGLLVAIAGGAVAALATFWTAGLFQVLLPPTRQPVSLPGDVDTTVLVTTLAIAVFTGVAVSAFPALWILRLDPVDALRASGRSQSVSRSEGRLTKGLVAAQVSMSLLLLICSGLFIRSFRYAQELDPGFNPDGVLLASFDLSAASYSKTDAAEFHQALLARLTSLPGVESATLANWVPLGFSEKETRAFPQGYVPRTGEALNSASALVGPGYFQTMRLPLTAGRGFARHDVVGSQAVAVVNEAFAARYWPGEDAVGKRVFAEDAWQTVVGLVRDSRYRDLAEERRPFVYLPLLQHPPRAATVHVRVSGEPLAFSRAVEAAVWGLEKDLPLYDVGPLAERIEIASAGQRIASRLVGGFGIVASVLAAIGIYAVTAFSTRRRTQEIGVRMALGAPRGEILRLVVFQGMRLVWAGVGVGLVLALLFTRFLMRSVLLGVGAADPLTFVAVFIVLCMVALLACSIPAIEATRVNPVTALKPE
jgi:predicted permease